MFCGRVDLRTNICSHLHNPGETAEFSCSCVTTGLRLHFALSPPTPSQWQDCSTLISASARFRRMVLQLSGSGFQMSHAENLCNHTLPRRRRDHNRPGKGWNCIAGLSRILRLAMVSQGQAWKGGLRSVVCQEAQLSKVLCSLQIS